MTAKPLVEFSQATTSSTSFMERITVAPAQALLHEAGLVSPLRNTLGGEGASVKILDNAAGSGIITSALFSSLEGADRSDLEVVCADLEPKMIELARDRFVKEGWSGIEFKVADAQKLPFNDNTFDFVLTNFGIQLIPDANLAVRETHRVLKPGGKTGFTTWKSTGWFEPLLSSSPSTNFLAFKAQVDSKGWTDPTAIESDLIAMGFKDVRVESIKFGVPCESVKWCVESLKTVMPKFFEDGANERMVKLLEERHGEGEFILDGWEAVLITATRA